MIVIVDYGMGNIRSVVNKLHRLGYEAIVSSKIEDIEKADKLILPGVGYFSKGMDNLKTLSLLEVLNDKVVNKRTPILGICLGMQLLTKHSEEGDSSGLGWIDAKTIKLKMKNENRNDLFRIPHMGWNSVKMEKQSPITERILSEDRFYFVHSYHIVCNNAENIVASTQYGLEFTSIIQNGNIFGTQFHPEKSHSSGTKILKNFLEINHV